MGKFRPVGQTTDLADCGKQWKLSIRKQYEQRGIPSRWQRLAEYESLTASEVANQSVDLQCLSSPLSDDRGRACITSPDLQFGRSQRSIRQNLHPSDKTPSDLSSLLVEDDR